MKDVKRNIPTDKPFHSRPARRRIIIRAAARLWKEFMRPVKVSEWGGGYDKAYNEAMTWRKQLTN